MFSRNTHVGKRVDGGAEPIRPPRRISRMQFDCKRCNLSVHANSRHVRSAADRMRRTATKSLRRITLFCPVTTARPVSSSAMCFNCIAASSGTDSLNIKRQAYKYARGQAICSPISRDLDLQRVRAKELHVGIGVAQKWKDETPRLWTTLHLEQFLL